MSAPSRSTASTLPQGFSVYQPALGAQLQFLPAVGTPQLDELLNAYVPGPASAQEKRASVSLDFLEYSHLTGQSFKFYPVYSLAAESPSTASPLQDSGYGSSFNASPVMSTWDWSRASNSSRSPTSQQARSSPKVASSRRQAADFSHIPGMKIMTKDGLDVTNSASRGSKTKEQRDHAHLMRIIKACDSCKRKKIRCDPSHKKSGASRPHSQSHSTAKVARKARAVAQEVRAATPAVAPQTDLSVSASSFAIDQSFAPMDLETLTPALSGLQSWEEFIQYPTADLPDDYDFFYDPQGYLSPLSSSLSACSTKPVTPASASSQHDLSGSLTLSTGEASVPSPQLPFNHTDSIHDYVDFNLFSPQSSFSEDDQMVPIEQSRQVVNQSRSLQSDLVRPDQSSGALGGDGVPDATVWSASPYASLDGGQSPRGPYRDPGLAAPQYYSPSSSLNSDVFSGSMNWIEETTFVPALQTASVSTNSLNIHPRNGDYENVALRNTGNNHETSIVERVATLAAVHQPAGLDTTTMTSDCVDIRADRVASVNGPISSRAIVRGESESPIDDFDILSTMEASAIANVAIATSAAFSSVSDGPLAVSGLGHDSDDLQITSVDAASTAQLTVVAHQGQSSISRGTATHATAISGNEALRPSLPERSIIVGADDLNSEALASNDGFRDMSSQTPADVAVQILAVDAPNADAALRVETAPRVETAHSVEAKTQTYHAKSTAVGGGISLSPLMMTAALVIASGSTKSSSEQYLTMMISAVLLFVAIANWTFRASLREFYGQKPNPQAGKVQSRGKQISLVASLCNRLQTSKSQASIGRMMVSRGLSQSRALMVV